MKKIYILLCLILVSCAPTITHINPNKRDYVDQPLNTPLTTEIGERLVIKGTEFYQDAYLIENTPPFSVGMVKYPYAQGDLLPLNGQNEEFKLYYVESASVNGSYQIGISENIKTGEILPFTNSVNGLSIKKVKGFSASKTEYIDKKCQNCFKKELVYNGKSGNTLKFVYREYVNDMARPAFNQDLQYDMNESKIIGIKGLRAEIINATNTKIDYKILNNFAD